MARRRSSSIPRIAGASIRAHSSPPRGSTSRPCAARRIRSSTSCSPACVARGYPLMRGPLPALLCRRQPRALRARPAHVRRPAAVLRQHPLDAGGRRARHDRARGRRRPGDLRPAHPGRRRDPRGSRGSTSPITGRCAGCSPRVHRDFGAAVLIDCHSMPSTAGAKDERPRADVVLGDRYGTSCVAAGRRDDRGTLRALRLFGRPQQALCRRLHHRALRQSGRGPACHPARDQPRALHGRAALRALGVVSRRWPPTWRRWPIASPRSRSQELRPYRRGSGIRRSSLAARCASETDHKKKGRLRNKRPKSREETPKEGSDNARRYRTATRYTAPHKGQEEK